jgi:hypothetical protein
VIRFAEIQGHARAPPCQHPLQQTCLRSHRCGFTYVTMVAAGMILSLSTKSPKTIRSSIWSQGHDHVHRHFSHGRRHSCDHDHASGRARDASHAGSEYPLLVLIASICDERDLLALTVRLLVFPPHSTTLKRPTNKMPHRQI